MNQYILPALLSLSIVTNLYSLYHYMQLKPSIDIDTEIIIRKIIELEGYILDNKNIKSS